MGGGFAGTEKLRSVGTQSASAVYTLTAGVYVGPISIPPILVYDNIGVLSGNSWVPRDINARYLVTVDLQNTGGGALQAAIANNGSILTFVSGQCGTGDHLSLRSDVIDLSIAGNITVECRNAATIGAPAGLLNPDCNKLTISKIVVE